MGIIENQIQGMTSATLGSFDYALLKDRCELVLKTDHVICGEGEDIISLKDGKYRIENGIIYLKNLILFLRSFLDRITSKLSFLWNFVRMDGQIILNRILVTEVP
jgi:hypothetical protein